MRDYTYLQVPVKLKCDEPWIVQTKYGTYKINAYQLIYITNEKEVNKEKGVVEARNVYGQTIAVFTEVVWFAKVRYFKGGDAITEDDGK